MAMYVPKDEDLRFPSLTNPKPLNTNLETFSTGLRPGQYLAYGTNASNQVVSPVVSNVVSGPSVMKAPATSEQLMPAQEGLFNQGAAAATRNGMFAPRLAPATVPSAEGGNRVVGLTPREEFIRRNPMSFTPKERADVQGKLDKALQFEQGIVAANRPTKEQIKLQLEDKKTEREMKKQGAITERTEAGLRTKKEIEDANRVVKMDMLEKEIASKHTLQSMSTEAGMRKLLVEIKSKADLEKANGDVKTARGYGLALLDRATELELSGLPGSKLQARSAKEEAARIMGIAPETTPATSPEAGNAAAPAPVGADANQNGISDADEAAAVWAKANKATNPIKAEAIMKKLKATYPNVYGKE